MTKYRIMKVTDGNNKVQYGIEYEVDNGWFYGFMHGPRYDWRKIRDEKYIPKLFLTVWEAEYYLKSRNETVEFVKEIVQ